MQRSNIFKYETTRSKKNTMLRSRNAYDACKIDPRIIFLA